MAYNDYGAFVYLNGIRQRDYEDVPVFGERDTNLGAGQRIYASLIRQFQDEGESGRLERPSRCHHGVMGDGKVRVGVYKTGLPGISIYVLRDGVAIEDGLPILRDGETGEYGINGTNPFETIIEGADEVIRRAGMTPLPFPKGYTGSDDDKAQADAWENQRYGEYLYEFDIADHRLLFEGRRCSNVIRPAYHARLVCPDGDVWDVFYDSDYGAGLSDCKFGGAGYDDRFDSIDADSIMTGDISAWPVCRFLPVRYRNRLGRKGLLREQAIIVSGSDLDELSQSLGLHGDEHGGDDAEGGHRDRILYRALIDEASDLEPVSTVSPDCTSQTIHPEVAIDLVRIGIELARLGVDDVRTEYGLGSDNSMESLPYGLDGTPFDGFSHLLSSRWMIPVEVRRDSQQLMRENGVSADEVIRNAFSEYRQACEEADGTIAIDSNDLGVEVRWPIRDAEGTPFSPLMQCDGDTLRWQVVRHAGQDEESGLREVVGCGWNDEDPFILFADGEMALPDEWVIVCDDDD